MSESRFVKCTDLGQFSRLSGEKDDRGRFQRAIQATAAGGELHVPPGEYLADSLVVKQSIQMIFSEKSKITAIEKNRDILTVEGTRDPENYVLKRPACRGDQVLQLTQAPTNWCAGDMIVLTDDTVRHGDKQKDVNTEVHEIALIEGSKIFLYDFVRLPKTVSKNVNVYRTQPVENIRIQNFSYQMQEGSIRGQGLLMNFVRHSVIDGVQGMRGAGSGIQVKKAMHIRVERFRFVKPQVTGSGQGYGVQFFGGCNHIVIQDGYTVRCRHSVDLDGCFDVFVSKVIDYHSTGAAFVMSHNGFSSDIQFDQCNTYHTLGAGFVACSQGFVDPLQCTFYHFAVTNCDVVMNSSAGACVYWYSPCKKSLVRDCKLSYLSGEKGIGLNNAGVRLYPAKSEILISGCMISGVRRGIALQVAGSINYGNDQSSITIRDTTIRNCNAAVLAQNGLRRNLRIYNLDCDRIISTLLELAGKGSFHELVIDGLALANSAICQFYTGGFRSKNVRGTIRNIRTDRRDFCLLNKPGWSLSETALFLYGDGETILLRGLPMPSSKSPLPDGLVEGQRLSLLIDDGEWILHRGKNMVFQPDQAKMILDQNRRATSLIWRDGNWYQV